MDIRTSILIVQHSISFLGVIVILSGILIAIGQYILTLNKINDDGKQINHIRLRLGRILVLGLEFIVAADLIGTTTTPDFYMLGMAAIIVLIRTFLSFTLNREIKDLSRIPS